MPLSQNGECSSGNAPTCLAAGRGSESPCVRYFLAKKREAEGCRSTWTVWATLPHLFAATSSGWDPLVGPHRRVFEVGTQWWDHIATSSRWDLLVGPRRHVLEVVHEPNDLWRFSFVVLWRFFCFRHYSSCQSSVTCYLWRGWKFRHRKRLFCDEICKRRDWIVIDEHISSSGLNGSVTSTIYYMTQNIGCIHM